MKYYTYNINNKMEYISSFQINDEEQSILLQQGVTTIAPPDTVQGKVWCFNGTDWNTLLDDYRGKQIFDITDSRKHKKGFYVGELPSNYTLNVPPDLKNKYIFNGIQWKITFDNTIFSKLQIRRACRELGIQDKLNSLISSNEIFSADWSDAQDIDLEDKVFLYALQQGDFTELEIQKIKETISHG